MNARYVLAQATDLGQALRLSHFQLELEAEELVIELLLLVQQFGIGQTSQFFDIHRLFSLGLHNACALLRLLRPHATFRAGQRSLRISPASLLFR